MKGAWSFGVKSAGRGKPEEVGRRQKATRQAATAAAVGKPKQCMRSPSANTGGAAALSCGIKECLKIIWGLARGGFEV